MTRKVGVDASGRGRRRVGGRRALCSDSSPSLRPTNLPSPASPSLASTSLSLSLVDLFVREPGSLSRRRPLSPMPPSQDGSAPSPSPPPRPATTTTPASSTASSSTPPHGAAAARPPPTQLPAGKPRSFRNSGFNLTLPPPTPAAGSGGQNPFDLIGSSSVGGGMTASGGGGGDGQSLPGSGHPLPQQQQGQMANPWAHLMASSGAPTPAIKGALSPFTFGGGAPEGSPFAPPPAPSSSPRPPTTAATQANGVRRPTSSKPGGVLSPDVKAMRELSLKDSANGHGGFPQHQHHHQPFTLSGVPNGAPAGRPPHQRVPSANGSVGGGGQGGALGPPAAQGSFRLSPPGGLPSLPGGRVAGGSVSGSGRTPFGSATYVSLPRVDFSSAR